MKTTMKIKLTNHKHFKEVAKALAEKGYEDVTDEPHYQKATALYAHELGNVTYSNTPEPDYFFESHNYTERFLVSDIKGERLVTKDYWTDPATIWQFYGPESEQFKKAQKEFYDKVTSYTETTYEPLPFHLKPRSEFLHERNVDIINVMLEYVTEGKRIPDDMISELGKNNEEIYNVR